MRKRRWSAEIAVCMMGRPDGQTDVMHPSAFQRGMRESGVYSIPAPVELLCVVAVPAGVTH